jgi:hypothetical protein
LRSFLPVVGPVAGIDGFVFGDRQRRRIVVVVVAVVVVGGEYAVGVTAVDGASNSDLVVSFRYGVSVARGSHVLVVYGKRHVARLTLNNSAEA